MNVFRLARPGRNALTSTNPNDFIFSSDWSTPQIVAEAAASPVLGTAASETFHNMAHGLNYTPFTTGFVKFADNRVGLIGTKAAGVEFYTTNLRMNATNIRFGYVNNTGGNYTPTFKYLALEIPLAGTPSIANPGGRRIVVAKPGYNALTDLNPDHKVYDSQFGTIKYDTDGENTLVIPAATPAANVTAVSETVLLTHNLGYYPVFGGNFEYSVDDPGKAYIMPITFSDAGFWTYDMLYVTTTQLIFRREFGNAFGGIPYSAQTVKIYWKLYSRDLEL